MQARWTPYDRAMVIDGLGSAFDADEPVPLPDATLEAVRASGMSAVSFTVPYPGDDFEATVVKLAHVQAAVGAHPDDLQIVRRYADLEEARHAGRLGLIVGFQNTEMFDEALDHIQTFHRLGVRVMQLTYNTRTQFGDGCLEPEDAGVSPLGRRAIATMNATGVTVDLSHAGPRTQAEGVAASTEPVLISHTGCDAIFANPRNTPDPVLRAVAGNGGVVGIYLMPFLAGGTGPLQTDMLMEHVDHALDVCGEDHVGIGSDQRVRPAVDGPEYRAWLAENVEERRRLGMSAPGESPDRPLFIPALNYARRMEGIAAAMAARGHGDRVIAKVLGENFARVFRATWRS